MEKGRRGAAEPGGTERERGKTEIFDAMLRATRFIDSGAVVAFAKAHAREGSDRDRAIRLYYAVRDGIRYDMMSFGLDLDQFVASNCLKSPPAFCVPKAIARRGGARRGNPARIASPMFATI